LAISLPLKLALCSLATGQFTILSLIVLVESSAQGITPVGLRITAAEAILINPIATSHFLNFTRNFFINDVA